MQKYKISAGASLIIYTVLINIDKQSFRTYGKCTHDEVFFFAVFIGADLELFEFLAHFSHRNKNLRASSRCWIKYRPPFFFNLSLSLKI